MNFKEFTTVLKEAKFRDISPKLMAQVKRIAKLYDEKYRLEEDEETLEYMSDGKVISKISDNPQWGIVYFDNLNDELKDVEYFAPDIASVTVDDLETGKSKVIKFIVIYGDHNDDYASYVGAFERINLFNANLYTFSTQRIESIILHELTHGFQQYKTPSDKYGENVKKSGEEFDAKKYYLEPIELDTHLNEIAFNVRKKYKMLIDSIKKAKEPSAKRLLENRLGVFLQELRVFTKSPLDVYLNLKELPLPKFLEDFESFLETIKTNQKYWAKFKTKMVNLHDELSKDQFIPRDEN